MTLPEVSGPPEVAYQTQMEVHANAVSSEVGRFRPAKKILATIAKVAFLIVLFVLLYPIFFFVAPLPVSALLPHPSSTVQFMQ